MITLKFAGKQVIARTVAQAKADMFDMLMNANMVEIFADSYTVQEGDTLYSIAEKLYGVKEKWKSIAAINRDVIPNAKYLVSGIHILLPWPVKIN